MLAETACPMYGGGYSWDTNGFYLDLYTKGKTQSKNTDLKTRATIQDGARGTAEKNISA